MASKKYLRLFDHNNATVIDLGDMEIWDGADLALLRDSLVRVAAQRPQAIGVDMTYVKYIPSGFFGMLFDYHEQGMKMRLLSPQPNVVRMLWFSRFFKPISENCFELRPEAHTAPQPPAFDRELEPVNTWNRSGVVMAGRGK